MGIASVFGRLGGGLGGFISRVFGNGPIRSDYPDFVEERLDNGTRFDYPVIFVPGPPNHNASRNRSVNDAALPFTPEEYKKLRDSIINDPTMNTLQKEAALKATLKSNPKWVPNRDTEPKEKLSPSSSAIRRLYITPDNKIKIQFASGDKEYTYKGGNTVREAARSVLDLINSPSIGKALNRRVNGSWASTHYDGSAV